MRTESRREKSQEGESKSVAHHERKREKEKEGKGLIARGMWTTTLNDEQVVGLFL